jgi:hypothetical protein
MDTSFPPEQPDLRLILPRDAYYVLVRTLHTSLPPPTPNTPEEIVRRDNAAIAQIAALLPANAAEAALAGQFVAGDSNASDSMRLAHDPAISPERATQCRAQSISMTRQSQSALRLLLRLQATRHKTEADPAAAERAAWTEHCAIGLMAQPAPAQSASAQPAPPPPNPIAEAEHYALHHRKRAVLIRHLRRLPRKINVGYIHPAVVQALITGTTPVLQALDKNPPAPTALAA